MPEGQQTATGGNGNGCKAAGTNRIGILALGVIGGLAVLGKVLCVVWISNGETGLVAIASACAGAIAGCLAPRQPGR